MLKQVYSQQHVGQLDTLLQNIMRERDCAPAQLAAQMGQVGLQVSDHLGQNLE